jgi:small subunit ribosomal protein S17
MKIFTGTIVSTKMAKTAKVAVESFVFHPRYKKRLSRTKNYLVHDELGAKVGDKVRFVAGKPVSKSKKWTITEILTEKKKERKRK